MTGAFTACTGAAWEDREETVRKNPRPDLDEVFQGEAIGNR